MARTVVEMTAAERTEYTTHKLRLDSALSTADEKKLSRARIDELEHRGASGTVLSEIAALRKRINYHEDVKKAGLTEGVKNLFSELKADFDQLKAGLIDANNAYNRAQKEFATFRADGPSRANMTSLMEDLGKANQRISELADTIDHESRGMRAAIIDVKAGLALSPVQTAKVNELIKAGTADVIAHAIEEAQNAIRAEATAAAVEAVGNLLGDGKANSA